MAQVVVTNIGHRGIIKMDALRQWGTTVEVAVRGVQLDTDSTKDTLRVWPSIGHCWTLTLVYLNTDGLGTETLANGENGPEGGTSWFWAAATTVIPRGACIGVPVAKEELGSHQRKHTDKWGPSSVGS